MLTRLKPLVSRYFRQSPSFLHRSCSSSGSRSRDEVYRELVEPDTEMTDLVDRYCYVPSMKQQVLVIQPFIRYGGQGKAATNHELMLAESVALVETLDWVVVDHLTVGLSSFLKKHLFGSGKLNLLKEKISTNTKITSVFISLYQLTVTQRLELERLFSVPVIDR